MDIISDATLVRQLRRLKLDENTPPSIEDWQKLLKYLDAHYKHVDEDRNMMARSLEVSTVEMAKIREIIAVERDQLRMTIGTFQTALDEFAEACRSARNSGGEDTTAITGARKRFNIAIINLLSQVNENSPENRELLNNLRASFVQVFEEVMSMVNPDTALSDDVVRLHQALIPASARYSFKGVNLAAQCTQLNAIGGDLWHARELPSGQVLFCMGDATGHGAAAGLFSTIMGAALDSWLNANTSVELDRLATHLDDVAARFGGGTMFMTWNAFLIDADRQGTAVLNAGHTFPILLRDGEAKALVIQGNPLGAFGETRAKPGRIKIQAGDRIVLASDGVAEARNAMGNEFGERRLRRLVETHSALQPETFAAAVWDEVTSFRSNFAMLDDASVLVADIQ